MGLYEIGDLMVEMDAAGRTARQAEPYRAVLPRKPHMTLSCDIPLIRLRRGLGRLRLLLKRRNGK